MRSLKSGARKKPWRVGSSQPRKDNTPCSRFPFLSFSLCCGSFFEDRSAWNGSCWAWRQRTRASWCHQDVAWCWCWEFARVEWAFRVVQGDNPFWESMSRRIESVIDAAGSWTKTVLKMTVLLTDQTCSAILVFSTPPMKQRKNWNEKNGKSYNN